ncbi:MAG: LacI family DNA-binding transcriptional regulator [Sediminicola sp.]
MKKLYLKDIAKNLQVSQTTVSLVLNKKGDENKISQETQKRIIEYAKEHRYVANQLARGLSRGKSETIGLIIPDISDTFYANIAGTIETKAMEMGYTVVFSSSYENPEKEKALIYSMLNRQVDGLILASTQKNSEEIITLQKNNFPVVLIDRHYPEIETNYVLVDNFGGIYKACSHLIGLGRKKIGFVTIKSELEAMRQRFLGYKKAVEDSSQIDQELCLRELDYKKYGTDMKEAIQEMVREGADSLVFSTHYLTREGIRALNDLGMKVPGQIAIVSFSDMSAFDLIDPPITSVVQPVGDIGKTALAILFDEMKVGTISTELDKKRILETKFVIRKSCGS